MDASSNPTLLSKLVQHADFTADYMHWGNRSHYQVLGRLQIKSKDGKTWIPGILYRDSSNKLYARSEEEFNKTFKAVS